MNLQKLCNDLKINLYSNLGDKKPLWKTIPNHKHYNCKITRGNKSYNVDYWSSREPTTTDVIYSLAMEAMRGEYSFEDFCSEFGYNSDSIQDHKIWETCVETRWELSKFLGNHYKDFIKAFC